MTSQANYGDDQEVYDDLKHTYGDVERFPAAALLRAIELGASAELVGRASTDYLEYKESGTDGWREPIRLSYVTELLAAGYDRELVRGLFERLALTDDSWGSHTTNRQAFWHDGEAAAALYHDSPEALRDFAKKIASDHAEELLQHHDTLAQRLGRPEFVTEILQAATWHLHMIGSETEFRLIRSLPIPDQIRAAVRVNAYHPWNLVLKGFVVARYDFRGRSGQRDLSALTSVMWRTCCHERPQNAPVYWRWFAEGFRRGFRPSHGITWRERLDSILDPDHEFGWPINGLTGMFGQAGCEFLVVRPIPRPGGSVLQVSIRTPKGPVFLRHQPDGPRGEQLRPGDMVVVSASQIADRRPDSQFDSRPVYLVELHKADVPTPSMLGNCALSFK